MSWSRCRFGDVVEVNPKVHLETGVEYPFLPMEDIEGGRKNNPPTQTRIFDKSGGSRFANDDSILARITPCLENGKASKVKGLLEGVGFGSTEFFVFRAVKDLTDPDFVYYLAISDIIRQPAIKSMVGASGRQRADKGVVENIIFNMPDLPTQRRIASILSAYDDLIENNSRRIALLEESMRLLYREWFVRLRFPGHEHVRLVDGLPEGWEKKTLGDVIVLNYGKGLKEEARINGGIPVYGSSGIVGYHNDALVSGPAIIVGRKGNVGSVYWCAGDCFPIDTVYFITSEQANPFIYLNLQHQHFVSSDVAVPGLNRNHAYAQPILIPSQKLLNQFNEIIDIIIREIEILKTTSTKLSEARDLLLPRLMSGEINV